MAKEAFITKKFSPANEALIIKINAILGEYQLQGYRLSLRQLYYQLVARALIENTVQSYKRIGGLVSDARLAGLVDWAMIEDRGRNLVQNAHWDSPAHIIRIAARQFQIHKWEDQPYYIEVMVEKDALSGVLEPVCAELDIPITANKGYSSSSAMYEAAKRLKRRQDEGKQVTIIYLGDHDPSGIDMTRDVDDRLAQFARTSRIEVVRIALNMDQVEQWNPPENPAKETDSRFADYAALFGESSWELDAVEPRTLASLVRTAVFERRDVDLWSRAVAREKLMKLEMEKYAEQAEEENFDPDDEDIEADQWEEDDDDYHDDEDEGDE